MKIIKTAAYERSKFGHADYGDLALILSDGASSEIIQISHNHAELEEMKTNEERQVRNKKYKYEIRPLRPGDEAMMKMYNMTEDADRYDANQDYYFNS